MEKQTIQYPNPEKQTDFDTVLEKLLTDEKYLHCAASLLTLTEGQYRAVYDLVTYRPSKNSKKEEDDEPVGKYAAKF